MSFTLPTSISHTDAHGRYHLVAVGDTVTYETRRGQLRTVTVEHVQWEDDTHTKAIFFGDDECWSYFEQIVLTRGTTL